MGHEEAFSSIVSFCGTLWRCDNGCSFGEFFRRDNKWFPAYFYITILADCGWADFYLRIFPSHLRFFSCGFCNGDTYWTGASHNETKFCARSRGSSERARFFRNKNLQFITGRGGESWCGIFNGNKVWTFCQFHRKFAGGWTHPRSGSIRYASFNFNWRHT